MAVKHEWRKKEKEYYLPKNRPEIVTLPQFSFITIHGEGSPAGQAFQDRVETLYSLAYGIKMLPKKREQKPEGYFDFTVYPLEGIWDIKEQVKKDFTGTINKEDLVYQLMIRQPDFVDKALFEEALNGVKKKKSNPLLDKVRFESLQEGKCVQMLHLGSYDDEPASFEKMETFAAENDLKRVSKTHREIYLSDARKVEPAKLKTVLRFKV